MQDTQETERPAATAGIWAEGGIVNFVMEHAEIIEFEGELVPGAGLTPAAAMRLARTLARMAHEAQRQRREMRRP